VLKEKDNKIEKQQAEITSLRKKNFEFRSRITDLEDRARAEGRHNSEAEGREPN
jgi:hypothetical protein